MSKNSFYGAMNMLRDLGRKMENSMDKIAANFDVQQGENDKLRKALEQIKERVHAKNINLPPLNLERDILKIVDEALGGEQ